MKILVFSDSHNNTRKMREAISLHKGDCEAVIFLGDGINDIQSLKAYYPQIAFFVVRGNCDFYCTNEDKEKLVCLGGISILITHGDLYGVKGGYGVIAQACEKQGADAVFFGHTHVAFDSVMEVNGKNIHLFNPGSIGRNGEYGIVYTSGKILVTSHGKIS